MKKTDEQIGTMIEEVDLVLRRRILKYDLHIRKPQKLKQFKQFKQSVEIVVHKKKKKTLKESGLRLCF